MKSLAIFLLVLLLWCVGLAAFGDPTAYALPRPLLNRDNLDFSFAGLKTAVMVTLRKLGPSPSAQDQADLAASRASASEAQALLQRPGAGAPKDHHNSAISAFKSTMLRIAARSEPSGYRYSSAARKATKALTA